MLFEELMTRISSSGTSYRWAITTLISVVSIKYAFNVFVLNLATASVPFHCSQVILDNQTQPLSAVLQNNTFAGNFSALDFTCTMAKLETGADGLLHNADPASGNPKCSSWNYKPDPENRWTMSMEHDMVCDSKYMADRLQTVLQIGVNIGTLFGLLGDIIGRRPFFLLLSHIDLASNIILLFVKDLTVQTVLIFFMGFGSQSTLVSVILITELVSEEYRGLHGNLMWILYVVGYCGSAAICYLVLNWRLQMVVVVVISTICYLPYIPVLPESPRWLLTRGKSKLAKKTLTVICKYSGCKDVLKEFNVEENDVVAASSNGKENEGCIYRLIPRDNLCRAEYFITLSVVTISLFTCSLVYFALSLQRNFISEDPYVNVLVSGLLELPAYLIAWQMTNRIGRKHPTIWTLFLSGLGLIILPFIPTHQGVAFQASNALAIFIKLCVCIAFSIMLVYGAEVLPTKVRSGSMSCASSIQTVGSILAPELGGILAAVYSDLPYLVYGGISILACFALLLLPETKDKPMPNTVAEMEPVRFSCSASLSANTKQV